MEKSENLTHESVLLEAAVSALLGEGQPGSQGRRFVDATFGGGGHSRLLLERLGEEERLLAFDCDEFAAARAAELQAVDSRFSFAHCNFVELESVLQEFSFVPVNGILFDLGLSSMQLDSDQRGFSFRYDAPLDMRFDRRSGLTAKQWLMASEEAEIIRILFQYGEEPESRRVGRALFAQRDAIETTAHLAQAVSACKRARVIPGRHPATRVFQAIRIVVNAELEGLQKGLEAAIAALVTGGRLVVIAFHSLEDRIVKRLTQGLTLPGLGKFPRFPLEAVGKKVFPDALEISANPRSRSARMRVFVKTDMATDGVSAGVWTGA